MTTTYRNIDDTWAQDPEDYASVEEFLAMCDACHGERPELVERDGYMVEVTTGRAILEIVN